RDPPVFELLEGGDARLDVIAHERPVLEEAAVVLDHERELAGLPGLGREHCERGEAERAQRSVEVRRANFHVLVLATAPDRAASADSRGTSRRSGWRHPGRGKEPARRAAARGGGPGGRPGPRACRPRAPHASASPPSPVSPSVPSRSPHRSPARARPRPPTAPPSATYCRFPPPAAGRGSRRPPPGRGR